MISVRPMTVRRLTQKCSRRSKRSCITDWRNAPKKPARSSKASNCRRDEASSQSRPRLFLTPRKRRRAAIGVKRLAFVPAAGRPEQRGVGFRHGCPPRSRSDPMECRCVGARVHHIDDRDRDRRDGIRPSPAGDAAKGRRAPTTRTHLFALDEALLQRATGAASLRFTGKDAEVESGQQAVAAVLIERAGETRKLLRVILPLGMRLLLAS